MRGWDLTNCAAKLELAMDGLKKARLDAASQWNDDTRREFEERYLVPLDAKLRRALEAIRHLGEVLKSAERECGDY